MNISTISIKFPWPVVVGFFVITIAGLYCFKILKVQYFPDLDLPTVVISADAPGATATQLEVDIARRIEQGVSLQQGVKHINTQVSEGKLTITVTFTLETSIDEALNETRSTLARIRNTLPSEIRDPIARRVGIEDYPIIAYGFDSDKKDVAALSQVFDDSIRKDLLSIEGIGEVNRVGGVDREILISLEPLKLEGLGISPFDVVRQIKSRQIKSSAGLLNSIDLERDIGVRINTPEASSFGRLPIILNGARIVELNQIASIEDTSSVVKSIVSVNGKTMVGFDISRGAGAGDIETGKAISEKIAAIKKRMPDLSFYEGFNRIEPIQDRFNASMDLIYEGALLSVLVIWLFIRNVRAMLIGAIAIPLSVLPTFVFLYYMGLTLNVFTLLALSLSIGILVDDAIVEIENISRHLMNGLSPTDATITATSEIGLAVVATTLANMAVFIPTAFMTGVVGRCFASFGWAAAIAIFFSLVVARLLTPVLAVHFLKSKRSKEEEKTGPYLRTYLSIVSYALENRSKVLTITIVFFLATLLSAGFISKGYIPVDDGLETQVHLSLPPGSTIHETSLRAEEVRRLIEKESYIIRTYSSIGKKDGNSIDNTKADIYIRLNNRKDRDLSKVEVEAHLREKLRNVIGLRLRVGMEGSGGLYTLNLSSASRSKLDHTARLFEKDLQNIKGIGSVYSDGAARSTNVIVDPDLTKAAQLGVEPHSIADALRVATSGEHEWLLPQMNTSERQVPVNVRLDNAYRGNLQVIERLRIPSSYPEIGSVMLKNIANISLISEPKLISRYDQFYTRRYDIEFGAFSLSKLEKAIRELPSISQMDTDVSIVKIGDAEMVEDMFKQFSWVLIFGVLSIYFILVLLFKDIFYPLVIISALPMAVSGSLLALILFHKDFSMPTLIGMLMLMGIAAKNSILLVESALHHRLSLNTELKDAILEACAKRARPIFMTSLAMTAGMLPMCIGWNGSDTSFRGPLALSVIGGVISSTFLSLIVIPTLLFIMHDARKHFLSCFDSLTKAVRN